MNNKIHTFIVSKSGETEVIQLFGYANKGLPGLELVGFGNHGRHLKEKLIFLSRENHLQLSPKRYVLCFEQHRSFIDPKKWEFCWLELPLLILFWSLAGHLPISRLDNCLASGAVELGGHISHFPVPLKTWGYLDEQYLRSGGFLNYIGDALPSRLENIHLICLQELLRSRVS